MPAAGRAAPVRSALPRRGRGSRESPRWFAWRRSARRARAEGAGRWRDWSCQRLLLRPGTQCSAARTARTKVAPGRGRRLEATGDEPGCKVGQPLLERGLVAGGEEVRDDLAGALEEAVGDVDPLGAGTQRGEGVDRPLPRIALSADNSGLPA